MAGVVITHTHTAVVALVDDTNPTEWLCNLLLIVVLNAACAEPQRVPSKKNYIVFIYDIIYQHKKHLVKKKNLGLSISIDQREINIIETHAPRKTNECMRSEQKSKRKTVESSISFTSQKDDDKDNPFFSAS